MRFHGHGASNLRLERGGNERKAGCRKGKPAIGCFVRPIVNVERGAVGLSIESMLKLCEIFHITPNELLLPHKQPGDSDIDWMIESLKAMSAEQRKIAVSIVGPYIETLLR